MTSDRARDLLSTSATAPHVAEHLARTAPGRDQGDYRCLAIAENRLMADVMSEKADAVRMVPSRALTYDDMFGSPTFRAAVARTVSERITHHPVDPSHVTPMAGAGSVIEALGWTLVDPGGGVLIPTPSYAGYWTDLGTRIGVHAVPAHTTPDDDFRITPDALTRAEASAGVDLGALLLTNPSNPLGRGLTDDEITTSVGWARERGLPIIVNEVYALSAHRPGAFRSIIDVLGGMAPDLHFVWAASKDLSASGLRAGIGISLDDDVREALAAHLYFSAVSGDTQHLLVTMLEDRAWFDRYVTTMRTRLSAAYASATDVLETHGIGYVEADAGLFVLADLRPWLPEATWEGEDALWRSILEHTGVNLTPGSACHVVEPGFVRICYATRDPAEVVEALERVAGFLTRGP